MTNYLNTLRKEFERCANKKIAIEQKAYLRNQFEFYGIKTPDRRRIQTPFLSKNFLPKKTELVSIVKLLWERPQREYHYFAQELATKYVKQFEKKDIELFEYMITNKSWWDTVDLISTKLVGEYFKKFPELRLKYQEKWVKSNNIWLQRTALLFQLKYKKNLDTTLLKNSINQLLGSNEFFINKAIGWILREYSRTNPNWVTEFVCKTNLATLSKKEALRLI